MSEAGNSHFARLGALLSRHGVLTVCFVIITGLLLLIHWHTVDPRISHEKLGPREAVIMDASRRAVLYSGGGRMCAEPAPDVIGTLAASASGSAVFGSLEDKTDVTTKLIQRVGGESVFKRAQGIQALRDGMFRLCEAYMNGAIDAFAYEGGMNDLITALNYMVPLEVCSSTVESLLSAAQSTSSRAPVSEPAGETEPLVDPPAENAESGTANAIVQGSLLFLSQCLSTGSNMATSIAANAAQRTRAYIDTREQTRRLVFATVLDSYPGAAKLRDYCADRDAYTHVFLADLCASIRFEEAVAPAPHVQAAPASTGSVRH